MLKSVDNPSLTVFLPPKEKATGAAVIVCPGGGFFQLTFGAEGVDAAKYLNSIGVAAFVLKYRLPRLTNSVYTMESPHQDGLRAMRLVRSRASEWGIDPNRLGMVGFSAGGEVILMSAFGDTAGITNAPDPIDQANARPDYIVEIYPGGGGIRRRCPQMRRPLFCSWPMTMTTPPPSSNCSRCIAPQKFRWRFTFSPGASTPLAWAAIPGSRPSKTRRNGWPTGWATTTSSIPPCRRRV